MSFHEKGQGLYSQQDSLFANPLAAPFKSPPLLPYTVPLDWRYCFLLLQSCLNITVIQINVHSVYRVTPSWTSSIAENRPEHAVIQD